MLVDTVDWSGGVESGLVAVCTLDFTEDLLSVDEDTVVDRSEVQ